MNKKVLVATINWNKTNKTGEIIVPLNNPTYSPQILDEAIFALEKL